LVVSKDVKMENMMVDQMVEKKVQNLVNKMVVLKAA
jgi:hypothetical protein